MAAFRRRDIQPNPELVTAIVTRSIASMIPTGFRWFSPEALGEDAELGKHIRAFGKVIGRLRLAMETQRYDIFTATNDLDLIGGALNIIRRPGEEDEDYELRISSELIAERVTPAAIERAVRAFSNNRANVQVYEPGYDVGIWGEKGRGKKRVADSHYYRGGVMDVRIDRHIPELDDFLNKARAAGVKAYTTLVMDAGLLYNQDPLAAIWPLDGLPMDFVGASIDLSIESVGCGTEFETVFFDMPSSIDVTAYAGHALTWASGLTFNNLVKNYVIETDIVASAALGSEVHRVRVEDDVTVDGPTELQPAPEIHYETTLGVSGIIGDGSL